MADEKKEKKILKTPTPVKRAKQDEKRRLRRHAFESRMKTAVRDVRDSVSEKADNKSLTEKLSLVYSLMDKGTKKHILKENKAARLKSKLAELIQKATA